MILTEMTKKVIFAERHDSVSVVTCGSQIDYESQKIKKTVLSTTVAELCSFMMCFRSCQFLGGLWMDMVR